MNRDLVAALRPSLVMTGLFAGLLGLAYPAAITGVAQVAFPWAANGSLVTDHGQVIGSDLIGQAFASPRYFHGRPSAAGSGYDASASAGSNLAPSSQALHDRVAAATKDLAATSPGSPVPPDLVTTSASGLDPHISPEAAFFQVSHVASARGLSPETVRALVAAHVEQPLLGLLGEPRVNVLRLNRALDEATVARAQGH
ncbi:potassium-transporting ATPase subunit KdpC [Novosphingobium sp. SG720]|uniref:potassium-transporting ATPase subunit KdpC n=1 Tax=Novosphingobium sp. SG720 TaxID=2586998 RepID=UPI001444F3CC|nr:potassium-transporting ATPase subunit KdpC [Novosphingobium sp. SG720]NKJ42067.1 K+-transporting ATPase ATPase C chain [Novosphingobium sp. SG720]